MEYSGKIIRGTTPPFDFTLPFDVALLEKCRVSFAQYSASKVKRIIVQKDIEKLTLNGTTVSLKLTQEETLKFRDKADIELELKVKVGGDVYEDKYLLECEGCVCEEVL